MAKHKLSRLERLKGLRKCLRSPRTPKWLRPSISGYAAKLASQLRREGRLA